MEKLPGPGLAGWSDSGGLAGQSSACCTTTSRPRERSSPVRIRTWSTGSGSSTATRGPSVVQVPDFGDRFWVYQAVDQRTDSFVQLGAMYETKPGCYLLAPAAWDGPVPDGIAGVFRFDTRIAVCVPRVFMDDTGRRPGRDPAGPQPDDDVPAERVHRCDAHHRLEHVAPLSRPGSPPHGEQETQWVDPRQFFDELPVVMAEVPARAGRGGDLRVAGARCCRPRPPTRDVAEQLRAAAVDANARLVADLFQFRNIGLPLPGHWSTQHNGALFGTDYLSRTAMGKANIFVNTPERDHVLLPGPRRSTASGCTGPTSTR